MNDLINYDNLLRALPFIEIDTVPKKGHSVPTV
jgi:hypothetical protein